MKSQPSFKQWLPVAVLMGIFASASVLITSLIASTIPSLAWVGASVWVLFISWAVWFATGARLSRLHKCIFSLSGGVVFGWLTLFVNSSVIAPLLGNFAGLWALPVTVFFVAVAIVLLELTDWFEIGYAYFFAFASYFAFLFGGFVAGVSPFTSAFYFWILLMAGLGLGILSSTLKNKLFIIERVPLDQRNTIFDKE